MHLRLEECLPKDLAGGRVGHQVKTVPQAGWAWAKSPPKETARRRPTEVILRFLCFLGVEQPDTGEARSRAGEVERGRLN